MTTRANPQISYSSMHTNDDQLFSDEQIARYDADTIKHRYGDNWRNYASNIREIKQADGTIVREYIIEDPSLLKEIKPPIDSASSTTGSDDDQQSSKHKFAQIKAKFEQKTFTNVMASPSASSPTSSHTISTTTRRASTRQTDDSHGRHTRASQDSSSSHRPNIDPSFVYPVLTSTIPSNSSSVLSQSISHVALRRVNSADEADEEVHRIHQESEEYRHRHEPASPMPPPPPPNNQPKLQSSVQYEVIDEDGNPMVIDDVHDLIKMSGVSAREVKQPNGTILREYVIDDPDILAKFRTHQQSPINSHPRSSHDNVPAPPPRVPLKQPPLFRQGGPNNEQQSPVNIQQVRVLEPQRRYEYITSTGKRIEFVITSLGADNQSVSDTEIREVANAINTRLMPSLPSAPGTTQQPFTLPKPWHPAVDLTHREVPARQRIGSDSQPLRHNFNTAFHQVQPPHTELSRSQSYGALNQASYQQTFAPVFTEPIIDWSALRQQDPMGHIDPQLVRQFIAQKHQSGGFQSSAQFLPGQPEAPKQQPQQLSRSAASSPQNQLPAYYHQGMPYPYQGQQQHGVRIMSTDNIDLSHQQQQQLQQQPPHVAMAGNGRARI